MPKSKQSQFVPVRAEPHPAATMFDRANVATTGLGEPCLDTDELHSYAAEAARAFWWLAKQRTLRACCIEVVCGGCVSRAVAERVVVCMYGQDVSAILAKV